MSDSFFYSSKAIVHDCTVKYTDSNKVHPNRDADDSIQLLSFVRFVSLWRVFGLNRIYQTLDYEVVLHLLVLEVEV